MAAVSSACNVVAGVSPSGSWCPVARVVVVGFASEIVVVLVVSKCTCVVTWHVTVVSWRCGGCAARHCAVVVVVIDVVIVCVW